MDKLFSTGFSLEGLLLDEEKSIKKKAARQNKLEALKAKNEVAEESEMSRFNRNVAQNLQTLKVSSPIGPTSLA